MTRQARMAIWGVTVSAAALSVLAGCCALDKPAAAPLVRVVPTTQYYQSDCPPVGPDVATAKAVRSRPGLGRTAAAEALAHNQAEPTTQASPPDEATEPTAIK